MTPALVSSLGKNVWNKPIKIRQIVVFQKLTKNYVNTSWQIRILKIKLSSKISTCFEFFAIFLVKTTWSTVMQRKTVAISRDFMCFQF